MRPPVRTCQPYSAQSARANQAALPHEISIRLSAFRLVSGMSSRVALYSLVGQDWAGDVAARVCQRLAVVSAAAHGSVQSETVDVGAQSVLQRAAGSPTTNRQGEKCDTYQRKNSRAWFGDGGDRHGRQDESAFQGARENGQVLPCVRVYQSV